MAYNALAGDYDNDVYTSDTKSYLKHVMYFELITILVYFLIYLVTLFL